MVDIADNLGLSMEIQTYGDKALKTLAYNHVIHSIKRMNMKRKNRVLQNVLFRMLQVCDNAFSFWTFTSCCHMIVKISGD